MLSALYLLKINKIHKYGGMILSKDKKNSKASNDDYNKLSKKYNFKWIINITIWTFFLAIIINVSSEAVLNNASTHFSFILLLIIIFLGVAADTVGIAVTAASDKPFHAMAADRVEGSKFAIKLLRNAGQVSNFCNDVIGDICGILSGVAGASIIVNMDITSLSISRTVLTVVLSGFVAAATVGGKALGKDIAINNSHKIVFNTARVLNFIHKKTGIEIIPSSKGKKIGRRE